MTRYSFVGQVVLNTDGSLGALLPGQAWTADVGGSDVTADLLSSPGNSPADFTTDATGTPPHIYGPDGVTTLWYSFGGGPRFPVQGVDVTDALLQDYIHGTLTGVSTGGSGVDQQARDAAASAAAAASTAQSTASTAQSTASTAQSTATSAQSTASTASSAAGSAATVAAAAQTATTTKVGSKRGASVPITIDYGTALPTSGRAIGDLFALITTGP